LAKNAVHGNLFRGPRFHPELGLIFGFGAHKIAFNLCERQERVVVLIEREPIVWSELTLFNNHTVDIVIPDPAWFMTQTTPHRVEFMQMRIMEILSYCSLISIAASLCLLQGKTRGIRKLHRFIGFR
jgi:hypothetical protein